MNKNIFIGVLVLIFLAEGCTKINYYPDVDIDTPKTKLLAHRAGGNDNNGFQENTLIAAENAFSKLDGIEIDVQLSKDRTIWLSYDVDLPNCSDLEHTCFPELTDKQIIAIDTCLGNSYSISKLEDIFSFVATNYPNKYISIDVKPWYPCAVSSSTVLGVMNVVADEIIALAVKYDLEDQICVESQITTFLDYLKRKNSRIDCYLVSLGDFERSMLVCLESAYDGISFKYKAHEEISIDHVRLIRKKGLKLQLWTIDSEELIEEAISLNPDFIQTNKLDYYDE